MSSAKKIGFIFISFLAYFAAARIGLELATINKQASPIWPATGIGIALILFFGPRAAIGIFAGAFFSNLETGLNPIATFSIALGNTFESYAFVTVFHQIFAKKELDEKYPWLLFGIFGLMAATFISALIGTLSLWGTSVIPPTALAKSLLTWWTGDILGALFLAPIAYSLRLKGLMGYSPNLKQAASAFCIIGLAILTSFFIFNLEQGRPYLFLIFIPILLAANWFESIWVYLLSVAICIFAILQTIAGNGPFVGNELNESLIHLQMFLAGLGATSLALTWIKPAELRAQSNIALVSGWCLAGVAFFFSYSATIEKDEGTFEDFVHRSRDAIEVRMNDYIQMLDSGVSFFNASEYVSQAEWRSFSIKLLSTSRYPGIEGIGVIFSSSIKDRFATETFSRYQPQKATYSISNLPNELVVSSPEEDFVISYIEPLETNRAAIGLNISSEKHRYEAAIKARDTGLPVISKLIQLVQDNKKRQGFLVFVPIYRGGLNKETVEERRAHLIGFVYAPVIFEKFFASAILPFENQVSMKAFGADAGAIDREVYASPLFKESSGKEIDGTLTLAEKTFDVKWKRAKGFKSSSGLVSAWIGFFGAIASLFLSMMLSSLQTVASKAKILAEKMTQEVHEKQKTWQVMTENSPNGIYLTDKDGACTYINPAWSKMTGLSMEQAKGYGWTKALHVDDTEKVVQHWKQFVEGGIFDCQYRFIHEDGRIVHVNGKATSFRNDNQEVIGYFGTVQDITELHQNQLAMISSSRMSSLGQMASGISHEINNPLAIIQGRAYALEMIHSSGPIDIEKAKLGLQQIQNTAQRIAKIIRGLRSFAREPSSDPFRDSLLETCLSDTLELCRERFTHFSTQLIVPDKIDKEFRFWGRSEQISQVLLNLLNNAFDATSDQLDRWVKVEVERTEDKIFVRVSDSGKGIVPDLESKIFDPFFTTKQVGKGTGLGLSISRGIVDQHQGRLFLDSSKSQTTFVLELPILKEWQKTGVAS